MDYALAVKTARMNAVRDMVDAGSGPGVLEIGTAGMATVLVRIPLNKPSGSATGDTLNFDASGLTAEAVAAGTAAAARIRDSSNADIVTGMLVRKASDPDSGQEVVLINTSIEADQPVTISSAKITHFTAP